MREKLLNFKTSNSIRIIIILIISIYYFWVLLKTGFISDDAYNSQVKGVIIQNGVTFHQHVVADFLGWLKGAGRVMIFSSYYHIGLYYLTQNPLIVKSIAISIIILGIIFYYLHSRHETQSIDLAFLFAITIPSFIQFRTWHDPVLGFTFLMPLIFLLLIIAVFGFEKYLSNKKVGWLIISVFSYFISLITYEISIPFLCIFLLIAKAYRPTIIESIKSSCIFLFLALTIILVSFYFKYITPKNVYPGAELHLDLTKFLYAFLIQVTASIPLSYDLLSSAHKNTYLFKLDYFFLGIFFLLFFYTSKNIRKNIHLIKNLTTWITVGLIFLILPAALTSLSGHQKDLIHIGFGYGYLPVYLQYFGACTLLLALYIWILKLSRGYSTIALILAVSILTTYIAGKNLGINRYVAQSTNAVFLYPRLILSKALQSELTAGIPNSAFIFQVGRYPSDNSWFFTTNTGKVLNICELSRQSDQAKKCISKILEAKVPEKEINGVLVLNTKDSNVWSLSYIFNKKTGGDGLVKLAKIDQIFVNQKTGNIVKLEFTDLRMYDADNDKVSKLHNELPSNFLDTIGNQDQDTSEIPRKSLVNLHSRNLEWEWAGHIYDREGSDSKNVRWASGNSTLILINTSKSSMAVKIEGDVATTASSTAILKFKWQNSTKQIAIGNVPKKISINLNVPPGILMIDFQSDALPLKNGDPRNIALGFFNFKIMQH